MNRPDSAPGRPVRESRDGVDRVEAPHPHTSRAPYQLAHPSQLTASLLTDLSSDVWPYLCRVTTPLRLCLPSPYDRANNIRGLNPATHLMVRDRYYCGSSSAIMARGVRIEMPFARQPARKNELAIAEDGSDDEWKGALQRLGRSGPKPLCACSSFRKHSGDFSWRLVTNFYHI
jgi:hypothetical protein